MTSPSAPLVTVGHGSHGQQAFADLLRTAGVHLLVDVRRFPGSRAHPHFTAQAMAAWLPDAGVEYRSEPRLGGRRRLPPGTASEDGWWTVEAFRAYAAHTRTPEFVAGLEEVLSELDGRSPSRAPDGVVGGPVAVMCSEAVWWRCHRRLVADVVTLLHGRPVLHVMPDGRATPHRPSEGARRRGKVLVWDGT